MTRTIEEIRLAIKHAGFALAYCDESGRVQLRQNGLVVGEDMMDRVMVTCGEESFPGPYFHLPTPRILALMHHYLSLTPEEIALCRLRPEDIVRERKFLIEQARKIFSAPLEMDGLKAAVSSKPKRRR